MLRHTRDDPGLEPSTIPGYVYSLQESSHFRMGSGGFVACCRHGRDDSHSPPAAPRIGLSQLTGFSGKTSRTRWTIIRFRAIIIRKGRNGPHVAGTRRMMCPGIGVTSGSSRTAHASHVSSAASPRRPVICPGCFPIRIGRIISRPSPFLPIGPGKAACRHGRAS